MLTSVWPTPEHPELAPFVVRQVQSLRKQGIDVKVLPVNGRRSPNRYFRAWIDVRAQLKRGAFDLVHAQWAQAAVPSLPAPLPLVVTFRGSDVEGIVNAGQRYTVSGWVLRQIARTVASVADEAILVAARMARLLPRREYHVIPSGLDLDQFRPCPQSEARARLGLAAERRYIFFPAAPNNPVKRYRLARSAVERLDARYSAELIVAGNLAPSVMPLYMNACDAMLLTSSHEGSPNVVKEALACNLPVVSTDVGDVRERIQNVEGCVLCPNDDPQALAAALEGVLQRKQRISGRPSVEELNESLLTRKVIAVYERALSNGRSGRHRAS